MLIPDNIETKLRFGRVRDAVSERCLTGIGRELVAEMAFMSDFDAVSLAVSRVAEMQAVLDAAEDYPAAEQDDVREALKRIRVEGLYLNESELLAVALILQQTEAVLSFFAAEPEEKYPLLRVMCESLVPFPLIAKRIDAVLDHHGVVKDTATPQLAEIRHEIKVQEANAARRLNAIMRKAQSEGLVEADASVSIRDGIAVIPIPAANKRSIGGIVVDESATGKTAFVQPSEVVAINSRVRELRSEERREIIRILKDVSSNIRPYAPDIIASSEMLGELDFLRAKALYAADIDAVVPKVDGGLGFYLSGARHPLLMQQLEAQGKKIVPLNIELTPPQSRILVISGPNAGGKSVCLQTVGLLQYMLQCGLPVPVNEGSSMCVFENIFIDIGDNQSIENDLSTYSSHLTAMKNFMRGANSRTLLLIDEFGTGTEPLLGGAIAQSVLAEFNRKEAMGVLTTHYTNLKHFASQTHGLVNGAMTFDVQKIEPRFALHIGQPGSSFAFEIARKIGLPEHILQDAKEQIGQENADYDRNLRQIVRDKHYWEQKRQNVKENDRKLAEVLQRYNEMLESAKGERKEIIRKAKEQAQALLSEANKQIENTIRTIKESQADKEKTREARKTLEEFKVEAQAANDEVDASIERKMEQIRRRQERQRERSKGKGAEAQQDGALAQPVPEAPIAEGDMVIIDGNDSHVGQVQSIKGKVAVIAMGNLSSSVKVDRLKRVSKAAASKPKPKVGIDYSNVASTVRERKLNFKSEIDVRGMRTDEALQLVSQLVDEAVMCEASQVRILHGKGNGILRIQIRRYLESLPYVQDARDEDVRFGGAGITLVDLG